MHRTITRGAALALVTAIVSLAPLPPLAAQDRPGGQPRPPENLKVLPKDIPRDSLLKIMRGFTLALGVRCQYCHVSEPGPNGQERLIFASDAREAKTKARFMLRMTDSLNRVVLAALPDRRSPAVRVQCVTCHRGSPVPQTLTTVLTAVVDSFGTAGADSAVARLVALRQEHSMEMGRLDLGEESVTDVARVFAERGQTAAALSLLQANQRFHPESAEIDWQLAELYRQQGDRGAAITHYRLVLTKRPNDPRATQRLKAMGADSTGTR